MVRVILSHVYVILMAIVVITTSNILAAQYGEDIVTSLKGLLSSTEAEISGIQSSTRDWNKKVLD